MNIIPLLPGLLIPDKCVHRQGNRRAVSREDLPRFDADERCPLHIGLPIVGIWVIPSGLLNLNQQRHVAVPIYRDHEVVSGSELARIDGVTKFAVVDGAIVHAKIVLAQEDLAELLIHGYDLIPELPATMFACWTALRLGLGWRIDDDLDNSLPELVVADLERHKVALGHLIQLDRLPTRSAENRSVKRHQVLLTQQMHHFGTVGKRTETAEVGPRRRKVSEHIPPPTHNLKSGHLKVPRPQPAKHEVITK